MRTFGPASFKALQGIHPDLRRVMDRALQDTPLDFRVLEGVRTLARQKVLVATGKSTTMRSRHLLAPNGYSHAVDIAPLIDGEVSWDWKAFHQIAPAVKKAAKTEGVKIEWGGDWKSFPDGPHWQLPWAEYPG